MYGSFDENDASLDGNQDGTVVSMPFDFMITIK